MKKLNLLLVLIFLAGILHAQDLTGISICINPGHGGHDSDDRFIEETGYWESEGNLTKGLYLRDILENCGATIIMTRVTNFTSDDLPLSQICQIANDNDVDYFQSIHSNAFNGSLNYPLILYRGYDNNPVFPDAKIMSQHIWNEFITNSNLVWNYGFANIRGDWDFYPQWGTQGLGVLRNLNMPGALSEGSFHDYYPESWRLQNLDYRKYEARNLASAFLTFYEEPDFETGMITGVVRDPYTNTNYYWVPNSNDEKIPVNGFKATLSPNDKIYWGDEMNNGVFFFDSINPGNYTIVFEADGYFNDTVDISVTAGETTIVDRYLPFDTTVPPVINSHYMPSLPDSVGATESITINFNSPMLRSNVEAAFTIEPAVNGEFVWENDDKTLIFEHTETFEKAEEYTVTISTDATNIWNIPIQEEYSFSFVTKDRNRLILLNMFPKNLDEVCNKLQFRLIFDAPLAQSSLIGNVILYNESNEVLATSLSALFDEDGKGYYFFLAYEELKKNRNYKLVLLPGIYDTDGNPFYETLEINFSTKKDGIISGTVIDNLNNIGEWQDPNISPHTQGTDNSATTFGLSPLYKISTPFSGKINYVFTENEGGVCAVLNENVPAIGSDDNDEFGIWVFGDLSDNILEYWFYDELYENASVFVDTINWAGWDLKYIQVNEIEGSGDKFFHSVVIKQNPEGSRKGEIYIDNLLSDLVVPVGIVNSLNYSIQNYPNPFNNYTTFAFNIPVASHVKLEIFNLAGQKVNTLKNHKTEPGFHKINWKGTNYNNTELRKGVYIYKFTATKLSDKSKTYTKSGICIKY